MLKWKHISSSTALSGIISSSLRHDSLTPQHFFIALREKHFCQHFLTTLQRENAQKKLLPAFVSKKQSASFCNVPPQLPHSSFFHMFAKKTHTASCQHCLATLPYTLVYPNAMPWNQSTWQRKIVTPDFPAWNLHVASGDYGFWVTTAARMWLQRGESMMERACHRWPICIDTMVYPPVKWDSSPTHVHPWSVTAIFTNRCIYNIHGRVFIVLWSEMANGQVNCRIFLYVVGKCEFAAECPLPLQSHKDD